jgi:hypothetical protein
MKFLWNALDRVFFVVVGALGTIATTYITGMLRVNPPELVVTQTYNRVDVRPVAASIGGLRLDYKKDEALSYGVYRVDIRNDGRGPAETVRFQVKIPKDITVSYHEQPDFKVYQPKLLEFKDNEFYTELPKFPSGADEFVALRIEGNEKLLCDARVKFVSEDYEGEVGKLKGVECN